MSKKADRELVELGRDKGCEYWDLCETCPYSKCKEDCASLNQFLCPMRYECIKMCFKLFPSPALMQAIFRVGKTTVYRALEKEE